MAKLQKVPASGMKIRRIAAKAGSAKKLAGHTEPTPRTVEVRDYSNSADLSTKVYLSRPERFGINE